MYAMLRGRKYKLICKKLNAEAGYCVDPKESHPKIVICSSIRSVRDFLRILIHEVDHGCNWDKAEEAVDEFSKDLADLLVRLGVTVDVAKAKQLMKGK